MIHPFQSKFTIRVEEVNQDNYFNKLVNERAMYEVYPEIIDYEMLEGARRKILTSQKGNIIDRKGTLMNVFQAAARVKSTRSNTIIWRLYLNEGDVRAMYMGSDQDPENAQYLGLNGEVFTLSLNSDVLGPNDVIIFESLRELPLLVRSHPMPDGDRYAYDFQIASDDDDLYLDLTWLREGQRLMQIGSYIGEATLERGNVHIGEAEAYIEFSVPMTRMGWQMKITDNAQRLSRNFRLSPSEDEPLERLGTSGDILYNSLEMKFEEAINHQIDLYLAYGRQAGRFAGRFLDGLTENYLSGGPGLYEFFEGALTVDIIPESFTIEQFTEWLPTAIWNDRVPIEQRVLDIYAGSGFLKMWQRACAAADNYGTIQLPELSYAQENPLFAGRNGVALNAKQYRAVFIDPFGLVRVHHLPFLDSELIDPRKYKGYPITSYEAFVFNTGLGDVRDANIYMLKNEEVEQFGYSTGLWGPLGPMLRPGMSGRFHNSGSRENAYWLIAEKMFGLVVQDPSGMVHFRPNFR
jgi:hypothetical protein